MAFRLAFRFRLAAANCAIIAAIVLIHLSPQILKIGQNYFFWIWFQVFVCQHVYVFYSSWESVLYRARKNSSRPFSARLHFLLRVAFVNKSQTAFSSIVNRVIRQYFQYLFNKNETLENCSVCLIDAYDYCYLDVRICQGIRNASEYPLTLIFVPPVLPTPLYNPSRPHTPHPTPHTYSRTSI